MGTVCFTGSVPVFAVGAHRHIGLCLITRNIASPLPSLIRQDWVVESDMGIVCFTGSVPVFAVGAHRHIGNGTDGTVRLRFC
jgi:uncharacterized membrane protein YgdD (TMEM256/DUF423 family)